jgi:hypothetical protein
MSTKVAKVSKTSTKATPAKAVSKTIEIKNVKSAAKGNAIRLSEDDKKTDIVNYILNPNTEKFVKRDTPLGKKLVKAEESGEEFPKTMTETERLILVVQTLQDELDLENSAIKNSLKSIATELPRGFPVIWGGKQKTTRLPDHPKQPSNAYIFFTKAIRQNVVEANPDLSNTEVVSMMAKMWKETKDEDRTEYNQEAAEDKERYEAEMKIFEAEHPDQARAKSSPGKPTKATAYHKYCEENREEVKKENPDMDGKEITSLLAEQWEDVKKDDDEHAKYQKLANDANQGFEERVTEYHETDSSKKLSEAEQKKKDDPEHYELNSKTGRYVRKEEPKKVASPKVASPKVASPKVASPKVASPKVASTEKITKTKQVVSKIESPPPSPMKSVKTKVKRVAAVSKTVSEEVVNDEIKMEIVEVEKNDVDIMIE